MKKLIFLIVTGIALSIFPADTKAQSSDFSPKMVIKTNPMAALGGPFWIIVVPVTGEYRALFEFKTVAKQSFTFGASYLGPSLLLNMDNLVNSTSGVSGIKTSGYKIQGIYKFYISRTEEALEGFYVGPQFSYAAASISSLDNPDDWVGALKINVNGIIGYQLIADSGFALDIYTGLGFAKREWAMSDSSDDIFSIDPINAGTLGVAFGLNFGFAF